MRHRYLAALAALTFILPHPASAEGMMLDLISADPADGIVFCNPEDETDCVKAVYATSGDQLSVTTNPQEVCTDLDMSNMLDVERRRDNTGFPNQNRFSMEDATDIPVLAEEIAYAQGRPIYVGIYRCALITPSVGFAALVCTDPNTRNLDLDTSPLFIGCARATLEGYDPENPH